MYCVKQTHERMCRIMQWLQLYLQKRSELKQHVYIAISDEDLPRIGKIQERTHSHCRLITQCYRTITTLSHIHLEHGPKHKAVTHADR